MNKQLKAFEKIVQEANECGMWHCATEIDIVEQALTPPTVDEVCEALSEFMGNDIVFIDKSFQLEDALFGSRFLIILYNDRTIGFNISLPLHLITMIGRFYEGEKK